jgi:hypothetical protein
MEEMRQGLFLSDAPLLLAISVYPINAGTAVATSTTEFGKAFFYDIDTRGFIRASHMYSFENY